jgi:hypothetical protein
MLSEKEFLALIESHNATPVMKLHYYINNGISGVSMEIDITRTCMTGKICFK